MATIRQRAIFSIIKGDLTKKMVFLGGPRQVGKTTLAQGLCETFPHALYLNWDSRPHRQQMLAQEWSPDTDLLIFDEIHKYPKWKSWLKGIWDTRSKGEHIIVTGSSRLDIFRRGGDSLQGRYRYFRLHPFSVSELSGKKLQASPFPRKPPTLIFGEKSDNMELLLKWGGFPEPLFAASERTLRLWQKDRFERVFREDIREVEQVRMLGQLELLGELLPQRVASGLSFQSLSEDIKVSPNTVKLWLDMLERNYFIFRVPAYHRRIERALKKEAKYYLWDWSEIANPGPRFENLVASHLLKLCHFYEDVFGISASLHYVRDRQKREVDFLVLWDGKPWLMVEVNTSPEEVPALAHFANVLGVTHRYQVCRKSGIDRLDRLTGIRILSADRFLTALI